MALIKKSLNAVTVAGIGSVIVFDTPKAYVSMQTIFVGTPDNSLVNLETSLDGVNFIEAAAASFNGPTDSIVQAANTPVLYARANLITLNAGATSVTAIIAAA